MMKWVSEQLLKQKIKEINSKDIANIEESDLILQSICERELRLIQKLKVEGFDMRGAVDELEQRLNGQSIYLMEKEKYEDMVYKAALLDKVKKIIN